MASTWSSGGLNLRLMTTGENDNTWGDQTNDNLKRLENKITGYAAVTLSGTTHTLTFTDNPTSYADEDGRNFVLNFGGSPGGTCTVTIPARETVYLVLNNTADSNTITLTTGSGTTFNVPAGKDAFVYSDGTNVYNAMADAIFTTITGDGSALTGVLHDVVDDTTPQLGGNLDLNSNNITGTGNINITGTATVTGLTTTGDINFGDNDKAQFGASNDLQIYHTGVDSFIRDAGTGNLRIQATNFKLENSGATQSMIEGTDGGAVDLRYAGSTRLYTTTGGVFITGGIEMTADLDMGDNDKILLGSSDDLQIYHTGTHSYVRDGGTGDLYLQGSSAIRLTDPTQSENFAVFNHNGAVNLYYDNSLKLATTSGGATVTGTLTATSFSGDGSALTGISGGGISWQSTIVTGTTLTAVAGNGYWIDTTSNECTITLPASASVGDTIELVDYARTWGTNKIIIDSNGLNYQGESFYPEYDTSGQALRIVYSGATKGWIPTSDEVSEEPNYTADFLVIAGGGYGKVSAPGGGGAGGYRNSYSTETSGRNSSSETHLTFTPGTVYTVTVGAGGTSGNGSNSSISGSGITTITSLGGGFGAQGGTSGANGGCGGGGGESASAGGSGTANQGFDGGYGNGGGGGASGNGYNGYGQGVGLPNGGLGGAGLASSITGSSVTRASGGSAYYASPSPVRSANVTGGGGGASQVNGVANTGGGGAADGGNGGSGVVILRMSTVNYSGTTTGSPTVSTSGSDTILTFTGSGSYTA